MISAEAKETLTLRAANVLWKIPIRACPWIDVKLAPGAADAAAEIARAVPKPPRATMARAVLLRPLRPAWCKRHGGRPMAPPPRAQVLANHASYFDTLLFVSHVRAFVA